MGQTIDMGALILRNERTRAVGNMGVNSRGDVIDSSNNVIDKKSQQMQRHYNRQSVATDMPDRQPVVSALEVDEFPELEELDNEEIVESDSPTSGLSAAISRAKSKKSEV